MKVMLRICFLLLLAGGVTYAQQQFKVIYNFHGTDGSGPYSLVMDASGNLYGTTLYGGNTEGICGSTGCGIVFELSTNPDGTWTEKVLHEFCSVGTYCSDGHDPDLLTLDSQGNLYGTTEGGGANYSGVAYQLTPSQGGAWTFNVLYSFCATNLCSDGAGPFGELAIDAAGNLYGTTVGGGFAGGTVFELSPSHLQRGGWTENVLYYFCARGGQCLDGYYPEGGVSFDTFGNLMGTTPTGGQYGEGCGRDGCGTVFKLSPTSGGWIYTLVNAPVPGVGTTPTTGTVTDADGSVYGMFPQRGANGGGALFVVYPNGKHAAAPMVSIDGTNPLFPLVPGNGVIYGTAAGSGFPLIPGTIFQMTSSGRESVLYRFCAQAACKDGYTPYGLLRNSSGALFGVAAGGGDSSNGVVFELNP
jgi:hypothetical protein